MNGIENKYLLFSVDEEYALALSDIGEIIQYREVTRVPDTPDYVAGIINMRGHVVPVIDVRKRFKKPEKQGDLSRRCIIFANVEDNQLGLIVDDVLDLIEIEPENLKEPPQVGNNYIHVFIKYIGIYGNTMQLIVDTDKLVNYNDLFFLENREAPDAEAPSEESAAE